MIRERICSHDHHQAGFSLSRPTQSGNPEVWIEEEWLVPSETAGEPAFSEADLARAKLIRDLTHDMGVNNEGVGVILNLLDQMHSLRKAMADLLPSTRERSVPADQDQAARE
jgi:chaperone modulatory protein CbpM